MTRPSAMAMNGDPALRGDANDRTDCCAEGLADDEIEASHDGPHARRSARHRMRARLGRGNFRGMPVSLTRRAMQHHALPAASLLFALTLAACSHARDELHIQPYQNSRIRVGEALRPVVQDGHAEPLAALDIDPTGNLLVTAAGADIRLWELPSGRLRGRLDGLDGPIRSVAFAWRDEFLYGYFSGLSVVWTDDAGLKEWELLDDRRSNVALGATRVVVGDAGELAATAPGFLLHAAGNAARGLIRFPFDELLPRGFDLAVWRTCDGCRPLHRVLAMSAEVGPIAFVPETLRIDGLPSHDRDPCGGPGQVHASPQTMALSLDGQRAVAAVDDRLLAWKFAPTVDRPKFVRPSADPLGSACLGSHGTTPVLALQFDRTGDRVRVVDDDALRVWNLADDTIAVEIQGLHPGPGLAVRPPMGPALAALSATRRWLAHAVDGEVAVWDLERSTRLASFSIAGPGRRISAIDLSVNLRVAVAREQRVEVWTPATDELVCIDDLAGQVAWSPDGARLAAWERQPPRATGVPRLIVRPQGALERDGLALALPAATYPLPPIAWADDRRLVVPVGTELAVLDAASGDSLAAIDLPPASAVQSLAVARGRVVALLHRRGDADLLLSASLDAEPRPRTVPLIATAGPLALAPAGDRVATVHRDAPAILWDTSDLHPTALDQPGAPPLTFEFFAFTAHGPLRVVRGGESLLLRHPRADGSRRRVLLPTTRVLALDTTHDGEFAALATADGVQLHRLDAAPHSRAVLVTAATGCDGLVVVDDQFVAATNQSTEIPVRLGAAISGALQATHTLRAAHRPADLMRRFMAGEPLPDRPDPLGAPTVNYAKLKDRNLAIDHNGQRTAKLCVTVQFADPRPPVERCMAANYKTITLPDAPVAEVFVRVCDPTGAVCTSTIRASKEHDLTGERR